MLGNLFFIILIKGCKIMEDIINFQIRDFGPIDECDMDIGKINIIGGPNASGKSTASKLLYCFLKASSNQRQEFAYESINESIMRIFSRLYDRRGHRIRDREMNFFELIEEYQNIKMELVTGEEELNKFIQRDIQHIDDSIELIQNNGDSFYISILKNLFRIEFSSKNLNGFVSFNEEFDEKSLINLSYFSYLDLDLKDSIDDSLKPKNYLDIYDVFYIDSFSMFDLDKFPITAVRRRRNYYDHVDYLRLLLRDTEDESVELFDDKRNKNIISVEKKIKNIIGGKFGYKDGKFGFISKKHGPIPIKDTASGIKQIAVIQLLLSSRKLKEDSFLIIDEPEVNLHPEWQFKLAEILVLLVKDLNISLYINTHSPMFIEAMEVFTKYYELEDDTYYYLTQPAKDSYRGGYKFKYIDIDDLYEIYDNLSKPYSRIDKYRLEVQSKVDDS